MKKIFYVIIVLFISCDSSEKEYIALPESDFSNFKNSHNYNQMIYVEQYTEDSLRIIFRDTIIAKIDSTLHSKIYDLKLNNSRHHEYPYPVNLSLSRNLSYSVFKTITKEFRKVFLQRFIFQLSNGKRIIKILPQFIQSENEFIDSRLKGYSPPEEMGYVPPETINNWIKPYLKLKKIVYTKIKKNDFVVLDFDGNKIKDYKAFIFENKPILNIFELDSTCTYQNYIDFISFSMKPILELRSDLISKGYSEAKAIEIYPMALYEKNVP